MSKTDLGCTTICCYHHIGLINCDLRGQFKKLPILSLSSINNSKLISTKWSMQKCQFCYFDPKQNDNKDQRQLITEKHIAFWCTGHYRDKSRSLRSNTAQCLVHYLLASPFRVGDLGCMLPVHASYALSWWFFRVRYAETTERRVESNKFQGSPIY
jgi:hypothetical protein